MGALKAVEPRILAPGRMALEFLIDDHFMGGVVNKSSDEASEPMPISWAVRTDLVGERE